MPDPEITPSTSGYIPEKIFEEFGRNKTCSSITKTKKTDDGSRKPKKSENLRNSLYKNDHTQKFEAAQAKLAA